MEHGQREKLATLRSAWTYRLCVVLLSASLALAACSPQLAFSGTPAATSTMQPQPTQSAAPAVGEIHPAITPATTSLGTEAAGNLVLPAPLPGNTADGPAARSYHAILLFERAADLLLAVIEKIQAGRISLGDSAAMAPYTNAFSLAAEALNQVSPPAEMEDVWHQVFMAARQYNQAYSMLNWGQTISPQNLDRLKETRQLLAIDQEMVEVYLAQSGLGPDFLSAQQRAVDQHLQQMYGNRPVPTLLP